MDAKWFRDRIADRELNQTRVGEMLGLHRSDITKIFNETRRLSPQEAADLARILAVPYEEVLRRAGVKLPQEKTAMVPVIGVADVAGVIDSHVDGPKKIARPSANFGDLSAIRIHAAHSPLDGWNAYFVPTSKIDPEAVGRMAVVAERAAGRGRNAPSKPMYLGVLEREPGRGNWQVTPLGHGHEPHVVDRVAVDWAAPVIWIQTNVA